MKHASLILLAMFCLTTTRVTAATDKEYGAYLAGECVICHQSAVVDQAIPVIAGMKAEDFGGAMRAYRAKERDHVVMQLIAGRLSDEDIAALAVYFEDLEKRNP